MAFVEMVEEAEPPQLVQVNGQAVGMAAASTSEEVSKKVPITIVTGMKE